MPLLLAVLLSLLLAAPAHAAWFSFQSLDGPSPDVERFGGIDLARDGTGGLVYVKREMGAPHVYVSRHLGGAWRAPERVDTGLDLGVTEAAVAAADGHRLAVVWTAGSRVYGVLFAEGAAPAGPTAPALIYDAGSGQVSGLSLDMGINGTAWATFTAPGGGGGDIKAVRLFGSSWEGVPGPLDVDPAQNAGQGGARSRVAVAADGNPVVVWSESHADGRRRAYGRRIYNLTPSAAPQELSVAAFDGQPAGNADSADIDIEWDGSFAWAVFRQDVGGVSRTLTRRLVGSQFEPAAAIDGGQPSGGPHVAINGRGTGFTTAAAGDTLLGGEFQFDKLKPAVRIDTAGGRAGEPLVAVSDNDNTDAAFAWRRGDGELRARYRPWEQSFEAEAVLSRPDFGSVPDGAYGITSDRTGDIAVGAITGDASARRVVVAVYDVPPGTPATSGDIGWQRRSRPTFRWRAGLDLWGSQTFRVLVDGVEVGRTLGETTLTPALPIPDGRHTWQVVAVDSRGQEKPGTLRRIGVDATAPKVRIRVRGTRRAGRPLRIAVTARDGAGSGTRTWRIFFGDGSRAVSARRAAHRFRAGTFRLRARVTDRAGNVGVGRLRLRVRR